MSIHRLLFLVLAAAKACFAARILAVIAVPSYSHQIFYRPLWREYLRRGHELTLITTNPMPAEDHHPKLRQIDVSVAYDGDESQFLTLLQLRNNKVGEVAFLFDFVFNATRRELQHPEVQQLVTNATVEFDLLLVEDIAAAMYVFKHRFDVPCIAVSSFDAPSWTHDYLGNAVHALMYPNEMLPVEGGILNRLGLVVFDFAVRLYYEWWLIPTIDEMIRETVPGLVPKDVPSVLELQQRVDMLFNNDNPMFTTIRPYSPSTISLAGGLHTSQPQNLTEELREFLDHSTEGVIYFSLGSNVKSRFLPPQLLNVFLDTFRQLPYNVLWKFDSLAAKHLPGNVKMTKWCPQQAVLGHRNVKVFVTQAGLQSLEEALVSGVPVVTMPFFMDQDANARRVVSSGIGVMLRYETLTAQEFRSAILEVATNKQYKQMTQKVARIILDKPMTPLASAIWHTEYLLRHGSGKHLKAARIPAYQYYYIDVIILSWVILKLFFYIFGRLLRGLRGFYCKVNKMAVAKVKLP